LNLYALAEIIFRGWTKSKKVSPQTPLPKSEYTITGQGQNKVKGNPNPSKSYETLQH
jgi:hypothetical protein